jgi:hypothetical protein
VTVQLMGDGTGTVTGNQISCPSTCAACFSNGAMVTLTATADSSSTFAGWSGGGCSGTDPCTVGVDSSPTIVATFNHNPVTLTVTNNGVTSGPRTATGTVTSQPAGVNCTNGGGGTCSAMEPYNSMVTLSVAPAALAGFGGWSGDCSGTQSTCTLTMSSARSVTASFGPLNYMFLSSQLTAPVNDLSFGALSNADMMCNLFAASGGLPGNYVAWLSTSKVNASSRLGIGGDATKPARGWVRPDGLPFVDSLTSGPVKQVFYPPWVTEKSIAIAQSGTFVVTATLDDGTYGPLGANSGSCKDWTSKLATDSCLVGLPNIVDSGNWSGNSLGFGEGCDQYSTLHMYCMEVDYNNAVVITPPSSRRIAFLSRSPFIANGGRDGADRQCAADAAAAGLSGTFVALLSTSSQAAAARFANGPPWVRPDGVMLTKPGDPALNVFQGGSHLAALNVNADGKTYCYNRALTGGCVTYVGGPADLTMKGAADGSDTCNNWTTNVGGGIYKVSTGSAGSADSGLFVENLNGDYCANRNLYIYCFQQ